MRRKAFFLTAVTAVAVIAVVINASPAAYAEAARTFVSGQGTDTGACPVTSPCRSFAYAVTQTAASGEIVVLNSAGYGPVTIAQSLTITNPGGVEAGVTATSGSNAITIDTTAASTITLRGLTLEGGGAGLNGINVTPSLPGSGSSLLNIIGCTVKDFTGSGLAFTVSSAGSPVFDLTLEKTPIGDWSAGTNAIATGAIKNNGTLFSFGDNAILDTLTGNAITTLSLK